MVVSKFLKPLNTGEDQIRDVEQYVFIPCESWPHAHPFFLVIKRQPKTSTISAFGLVTLERIITEPRKHDANQEVVICSPVVNFCHVRAANALRDLRQRTGHAVDQQTLQQSHCTKTL